jgi:hypothetical protein
MTNLKAEPGEMRATIQVTRKATGKVETFELVGHPDPEVLQKILTKQQEKHDGRHP